MDGTNEPDKFIFHLDQYFNTPHQYTKTIYFIKHIFQFKWKFVEAIQSQFKSNRTLLYYFISISYSASFSQILILLFFSILFLGKCFVSHFEKSNIMLCHGSRVNNVYGHVCLLLQEDLRR